MCSLPFGEAGWPCVPLRDGDPLAVVVGAPLFRVVPPAVIGAALVYRVPLVGARLPEPFAVRASLGGGGGG